MRIERVWSAMCVAMVGLMGCDSGAGAVPLEELRERTIEASCAFYFGCCSAAGREGRLPDTVTSEAECIEYRTAQDWDVEAEVRASVESGRYRYDASAAGACLAQVRSCEVDGCFFATGIVENGGDCDSSFECVSQLCGGPSGSGTCVARSREGEECFGSVCDRGLTCSADNVCRPLLEDGAACTRSEDCRSVWCDAGVCAPRPVCE